MIAYIFRFKKNFLPQAECSDSRYYYDKCITKIRIISDIDLLAYEMPVRSQVNL